MAVKIQYVKSETRCGRANSPKEAVVKVVTTRATKVETLMVKDVRGSSLLVECNE